MSRIRCYLLEPTNEEWHSEDGHITAPLYRDSRTGALVTLRDAEPGAITRAQWCSWVPSQDEDAPIVVKLPNGDLWYVDDEAANCTRKGDLSHHCWIRHGALPDVTVDKQGETCAAGAGSILSGSYHGFLRNGWLED